MKKIEQTIKKKKSSYKKRKFLKEKEKVGVNLRPD